MSSRDGTLSVFDDPFITMREIEFKPEMEDAILDGKKCCTTRSSRKGEPGDIFVVRGKAFRIVTVLPMKLETILDDLFQAEGFVSRYEFRRFLNRVWRGNVKTDRTYFVHFFAHIIDD